VQNSRQTLVLRVRRASVSRARDGEVAVAGGRRQSGVGGFAGQVVRRIAFQVLLTRTRTSTTTTFPPLRFGNDGESNNASGRNRKLTPFPNVTTTIEIPGGGFQESTQKSCFYTHIVPIAIEEGVEEGEGQF